MGEPPGNGSEGEAAPFVVLFLGLYLITLAFFVLLNAMARPEEARMRAVLDSVASAFTSDRGLAAIPNHLASDGGLDVAPLEEVRALFESLVPLARVAVYDPSGRMAVELPAAHVFVRDTARIRKNRAPFLERLAAILRRPLPAARLEVEMLLGLGGAGEDDADAGRLLGVRRAAALVGALEQRNVASRQLVAGVGPGDPAQIRLLFNLRFMDAAGSGPTSGGSWP